MPLPGSFTVLPYLLHARMQIDDMMERRVRDFRLDTRLRTACEEDIYTMCAYFGVSVNKCARQEIFHKDYQTEPMVGRSG